jgi:hypothetical protein
VGGAHGRRGRSGFAAAFHLGAAPTSVRLRLDAVDGRPGDSVTDLWSGTPVEVRDGHVQLPIDAHGARLLRLDPAIRGQK